MGHDAGIYSIIIVAHQLEDVPYSQIIDNLMCELGRYSRYIAGYGTDWCCSIAHFVTSVVFDKFQRMKRIRKGYCGASRDKATLGAKGTAQTA